MSMKIEKGKRFVVVDWCSSSSAAAAARRRVVMTKQCGPIWRLKGADENVAHVATPTKGSSCKVFLLSLQIIQIEPRKIPHTSFIVVKKVRVY